MNKFITIALIALGVAGCSTANIPPGVGERAFPAPGWSTSGNGEFYCRETPRCGPSVAMVSLSTREGPSSIYSAEEMYGSPRISEQRRRELFTSIFESTGRVDVTSYRLQKGPFPGYYAEMKVDSWRGRPGAAVLHVRAKGNQIASVRSFSQSLAIARANARRINPATLLRNGN